MSLLGTSRDWGYYSRLGLSLVSQLPICPGPDRAMVLLLRRKKEKNLSHEIPDSWINLDANSKTWAANTAYVSLMIDESCNVQYYFSTLPLNESTSTKETKGNLQCITLVIDESCNTTLVNETIIVQRINQSFERNKSSTFSHYFVTMMTTLSVLE